MAVRTLQPNGRRPALDDLDKAIIKCLQLDGRRPFAQIGRELEVPEATVRQRAERLISRGVVQVVGVTDPLAMGFQQPALIGLKVDPGRLTAIADEIGALEEVTYLVVTAGRYRPRVRGGVRGQRSSAPRAHRAVRADQGHSLDGDTGRAEIHQGELPVGRSLGGRP
jgi:DNA-binding Lrp family transcriptional regulator